MSFRSVVSYPSHHKLISLIPIISLHIMRDTDNADLHHTQSMILTDLPLLDFHWKYVGI